VNQTISPPRDRRQDHGTCTACGRDLVFLAQYGPALEIVGGHWFHVLGSAPQSYGSEGFGITHDPDPGTESENRAMWGDR
jgi:hypothetical protein